MELPMLKIRRDGVRALLCIALAWPMGAEAQQEVYGGDYSNPPSSYNNAPSAPVPTVALPNRSSGTSDTYMETRVSDLETQLRTMNGRLEQAEWQNRKLQTQLDKAQSDLELRVQALEQSGGHAAALAPTTTPQLTTPPAAAPASRRTPVTFGGARDRAESDAIDQLANEPADAASDGTTKPVTGKLGSLYMSGNQVKGADQEAVKPALPKPPADYGLTAQEQYDQAFAQLRSNDYAGAETALQSFISKNPKHALVGNAKYWLGESHYARAQYDAAAVAFADSYQSAPKGNKAPDSLFKLGMALAGLKKTADACTTLAEVGTRYPNASASLKTRTAQEMQKLKCK
jgi:tol-pal system protein YbgF